MSIANNSVLRRILLEVRDGAAPSVWSEPLRGEHDGQLLEVRSTRHVHAPPFATSLHFWAHALRAFLETRGRPELYEALAANCLCEATAAERVTPTLDALLGRIPKGIRLSATAFIGGYRMIDQDVLVSWVAESDREFVAVFWTRTDWLDRARPLVFE